MHRIASTRPLGLELSGDRILNASARFWFVVAACGLWTFASYVAVLYLGSAVRGDFEAWNQVFSRGYVAGDARGNLAVGMGLGTFAATMSLWLPHMT